MNGMDGIIKIVLLVLAWLVAVLVAALAAPFIMLWPSRLTDISWKQVVAARARRVHDLGRMIVYVCDHSFLGPLLPWDYRK